MLDHCCCSKIRYDRRKVVVVEGAFYKFENDVIWEQRIPHIEGL